MASGFKNVSNGQNKMNVYITTIKHETRDQKNYDIQLHQKTNFTICGLMSSLIGNWILIDLLLQNKLTIKLVGTQMGSEYSGG